MAGESKLFTDSLVDQVYNYILNKIRENELSYGDVINIKELSQILGISAMPVREAIKKLESNKLVEVKPRSSCQIRIPDQDEIDDLFELREVLELESIKRFLKGNNQALLDPLRDVVKGMLELSKTKLSEEDYKHLMNLDTRFHTEICALSGNQKFYELHENILLHLNMKMIHKKSYSHLAETHYESHHIILKKLEENSVESIDYLKKHFDNIRNYLH